ncbi:Metallo-dependent phosphatase [Lentinus tigrinus ALCF2SS1-7]|uniref:Metallo-dependent phosphatase n=1 Tax=Lentinus tigrinus ALCF2SS1-6 TaxID=1328759 RepID=A0A5C2S600_9APHY|nr:Metallo-dependent phosphatase [Lentinus tigrinus ALCF2SS1-6]RPD73431.1 Metallo-dependent phosphatase [Lentinus tigrinus ALCF2SS1-7]
MSAFTAIANSGISTLYRILVYLFLEVVPKSELKYIIPALYLAYAATLPAATPLFTQVVAIQEEKVVVEEKPDSNGELVTDVTVSETTLVAPVPQPLEWSSAFKSIFFSVPSPVPILRYANLAINTLLLFAVAEFLLVPYFDDASGVVYTRVGALYPDAAKIVVRYPPTTNATQNLVRLSWRQVDTKGSTDAPWRDGPLANLTADSDWVSTLRLSGLWPTTTYEYRFEDLNDTVLPYPAEPIRFRTFPDSRLYSGSNFRFLASSCMTPNFPYAPLQSRRIKGFDLLADTLWPKSSAPLVSQVVPTSSSAEAPESTTSDAVPAASHTSENATVLVSNVTLPVAPEKPEPPTEFMIFLGDFIYADVPVYYGDDQEAYRRFYRRNYNSPSFRKVYERLPIFHTYDDHEIINNYVGQGNDSKGPFPSASNAFELYNANANFDSPAEGQYYYDFKYGDAAFFVMDTRRYRSDISVGDPTTHTMLGDQQLAALYNWLGKVNQTAVFKFIVTSVPFTSLWTYEGPVETWAGFPAEKAALLSALHTVPNVIILSGDRHEFAAIEFEAGDWGHNVLEISTSPMSMFYVPFIRTLLPRSEEIVNKTRENVIVNEDGSKEVLQYVVEVPKERVLQYIAEGNYKWSWIEVDTKDHQHPVVNVDIMINGKSAYKLEVVGKPVKLQLSTALGAFVPQSFKGMLDRIGLKPSKWF